MLTDPYEVVLQKDLKEHLSQALDTLRPREARVIRMYFGLDCDEHTLVAISTELAVTRERVRGIVNSAIRKLRHPSRCRRLKCFW